MTESPKHSNIGILRNLPESISFLAVPAMRFSIETADQISESEKRELAEIAKKMREGNYSKLVDEFLTEYPMTKFDESLRLANLFRLFDRLNLIYKNYLLSFVTDDSGTMVSIHMDLNGADQLIEKLKRLRESLTENDCPHDHLFEYDGDLTSTMLDNSNSEKNCVGHVKIYGWNDEWAVKHKLRPF